MIDDAEKAAAALLALDREESRRSFERFARIAWREVEANDLRWGWHMSAICAHLEAVSRGQIRDLVICVPPGCSKSLLASTLWPAWDWAEIDPSRRTILGAYGADLSEKSARLLHTLISSAWYRARWPHASADAKGDNRVEFFRNRSKGWHMATSVGGRALGFHADILKGDDLAKAPDQSGRGYVDPVEIEKANQFWFGTLHTRRADAATTRRVLIGQRLHHADTPGRAIEAGYEALVLPMEYVPRTSCFVRTTGFRDPRTEAGELLNPARFPREVVERDKSPNAMGPAWFAAQMQQDPTPPDGLLFKKVADRRWKVDRETGGAPVGRRTIITCDAAFKDTAKSDFVALQAWRQVGTDFCLLARVCERMSATATVRRLFDFAAMFPNTPIYIEDKANGTAIMDLFRSELPQMIPWDPGNAPKATRAEAKAWLFEQGRCYLPPDELAPWALEYAAQLQRFPLAKHDDDVDATTMALMILDPAGSAAYEEAMRKLSAELRGGRVDD